MSMKDLSLRPLRAEDIKQLELFRGNYNDADIEIPFGYSGQGIETAIAEKNGQIVGAVTASAAVTFDFIHDNDAAGTDVFPAVFMLERALALTANKAGIATAYVAIPSHLTKYIDMVKRCGYTEEFQHCVVLRRALRQETVPRLGDVRDAEATKITVE
jgi:hypothetical protein